MNVLGTEQLEISLRLTGLILPVCLYFFLLGLLNTRRCPQLLSARQDTALLMVALSPLLLQPMISTFGASTVTLLVGAGMLGAVVMLAPRHGWTIYNIAAEEAMDITESLLAELGYSPKRSARHFDLPDGGRVEFGGFPPLRTVSIRFKNVDRSLLDGAEVIFAQRLGRIEATASPVAMGMLLAAVGMVVAPMCLLAQNTPEMVRLLTDLLK